MNFPTLSDILPDVLAYRDDLQAYSPEDIADEEGNPCGDIRLQVTSNGSWAIHTGDSSYDQDHRGYWGAGCISPTDTDEQCANVAQDLLDQAGEDCVISEETESDEE